MQHSTQYFVIILEWFSDIFTFFELSTSLHESNHPL
jgi:hypothetical protein